MKGTKPWYQSKGVLGGIASGVAGLAMMLQLVFHVDISDLTTQLTAGLVATVGLVGTVMAIYGRITATKQIGDPPIVSPPATGG